MVFCYDDIASPRSCLSERFPLDLNVADKLVDWKGHSVTGNDRVKYDIWMRKLLVHAVQRFHKVIRPSARSKALGDVVHIHFGMRHTNGQSAVGC